MLSTLSIAGVHSLLITFGAVPDGDNWTTREVFVFYLATGLPALGIFAAGVWAWLKYAHGKRLSDLERDRQALQQNCQAAQLEKLSLLTEKQMREQKVKELTEELAVIKQEKAPRRVEYEEVKKRLEEVQSRARQLEEMVKERDLVSAAEREQLQGLQASLVDLTRELGEYDRKLRATTNRIQRSLKLEGLIWEDTVYSNAPPFRPLTESGRRTPVISVLNLKGGVGKTTLAANLGAAFSAKGYRVLLIDLDLQGSLTGLLLSEEEQQSLYEKRLLVQDFFNGIGEDVATNLLDYIWPIYDGKSGLLATADTLAYTELNLTFKWLLRIGNRDPRFLLRKALHMKRITRNYDIILIDCPPLMNVSCVNAMAASDYLLIPVMPSRQATNRVPPLLKILKSFREQINPELKVLGVAANRTQRTELTTDEMNRWSLLRTNCADQWGQAVYMCETTIRQSAEFRVIEDERRPLADSDEMYPVILSLAEELEKQLPTYCRLADRSGATEEITS